MANYPASKDDLFAGTSDTVDPTDEVDGAPGPGSLSTLLNALADVCNAIEDELGLDPAGASATVVARLDALDTTVAAKGTLSNVVEDTTPQLGGALDVNGQEITGAIDLHSTGDVIAELGDAAGANKLSVRDSAAVEVAAVDSDGNITTAGTVDGRDLAADGSKLDGIETAATADQTAAEIKTAYESNADTNEFSDAEQTKLAGIETAADVTDAANVAAAGAPIISSGAGAPGSTPAAVGDIYIDTTADRAYIATDTASSADWDLLPITAAHLSLVIGTDVQAWSAALDAVTGTNTGDEVAASTTVAGVAELATTAETTTGTDTARTVTPDGLAGSVFGEKSWCLAVTESDTDCATGDGTVGFCVPSSMDAMDIVAVVASVHTAGTTGTMDIQIRRRRATTDVDVLSTKVTIDSTETSSTTAATAYVINAANDDLNEGDVIYIDVDAVHTTAAKGLSVTVTARTP